MLKITVVFNGELSPYFFPSKYSVTVESITSYTFRLISQEIRDNNSHET